MSSKDWPHAPIHRFDSDGIYMVTGATLHKQRLFSTPSKLTVLENELLALSEKYHWQLQAWAVFANHYHFVARGLPDKAALGKFLGHLHTKTAIELNKLDEAKGREVCTTSGIRS